MSVLLLFQLFCKVVLTNIHAKKKPVAHFGLLCHNTPSIMPQLKSKTNCVVIKLDEVLIADYVMRHIRECAVHIAECDIQYCISQLSVIVLALIDAFSADLTVFN